jgi:hypothetical protein
MCYYKFFIFTSQHSIYWFNILNMLSQHLLYDLCYCTCKVFKGTFRYLIVVRADIFSTLL